ncbi:hypothetical protein [Pendulispora rubella]|uniref:hypothetical protein n=1 Tax=Pendulispora rubella TaxID=2741070 RepID=UPI00374E0E2A
MRAWYVASSLIALAGIAAASFIACDSSEDCTFSADGCGRVTKDAGPDGNGQVWPVGCDPNADPGDSLPCVDGSVAIFVAPKDKGGSDGGAGTKDSPVSSLRVALEKVGVRPRIYVCGGNYEEAVTINRRVSIFGGFDCSGNNWTVPKGAPVATNIVPKDPGVALTVQAVSEAIALMDLSFTAKDAAAAGGNSVAGWVTQSKDVTFKRVAFTAGAGSDGTPKDEPKIDPYSPASAPSGIDSDGGAPGDEQRNTCNNLVAPNNVSIGGAGGDKGDTRGVDGGAGREPIARDASPEDYFNGAGGQGIITSGVCGVANDTGAHPGAYGAGGVASPAAGVLGAVSSTGYQSPNGPKGGDGQTAQGGGGGGGKAGTGGPGGGGGAGGCGGQGGVGGQAGGSAISLLVYRTKVHLLDSTLKAGAAGKGGHGGKGQKAQGAPVRAGSGASGGCSGERGGPGGSGAGGNGGAGGSSIGLAYAGDAPNAPDIGGKAVTQDIDTQDKWITTPPGQNHGLKGSGGDAVASDSKAGASGFDGPDGVAKAAVLLQAQ